MTKTPWYHGTIKPVHEGEYECKHRPSGRIEKDYWRGVWGFVLNGVFCPYSAGAQDEGEWRGLTEEAK